VRADLHVRDRTNERSEQGFALAIDVSARVMERIICEKVFAIL
jgi:hypothetical protein